VGGRGARAGGARAARAGERPRRFLEAHRRRGAAGGAARGRAARARRARASGRGGFSTRRRAPSTLTVRKRKSTPIVEM